MKPGQVEIKVSSSIDDEQNETNRGAVIDFIESSLEQVEMLVREEGGDICTIGSGTKNNSTDISLDRGLVPIPEESDRSSFQSTNSNTPASKKDII